MSNVQIIKTPGGEELVVMSKTDYDAMTEALADAEEDAADAAIYDARKAELEAGNDEALPADLSRLLLAGNRRLRAVRKWRDLNQNDVAQAVGISQSYLSALETGARVLTDDLAEKFAATFTVPVKWIEEG